MPAAGDGAVRLVSSDVQGNSRVLSNTPKQQGYGGCSLMETLQTASKDAGKNVCALEGYIL